MRNEIERIISQIFASFLFLILLALTAQAQQQIIDPITGECQERGKNQNKLDYVCQALLIDATRVLQQSDNMFLVIYGYRTKSEKEGADIEKCKKAVRFIKKYLKDQQKVKAKVKIVAKGVSERKYQIEYLVLPDTGAIREWALKK